MSYKIPLDLKYFKSHVFTFCKGCTSSGILCVFEIFPKDWVVRIYAISLYFINFDAHFFSRSFISDKLQEVNGKKDDNDNREEIRYTLSVLFGSYWRFASYNGL